MAMSNPREAVAIAQLNERLRQERELFDQRKKQDIRSFHLWIAMGWTAVVLFIAICAFSGFVIVNHAEFADGIVALAASALLVEALGLVATVWKAAIGSRPKRLEPTTAPLQEAEEVA